MKRNIYFHENNLERGLKVEVKKRVKESIIYHTENTEKEPFKGLEAVLKYRKRLSI